MKGEAYPITGMRGKRIKSLIQHDISLLVYHLPSTAIRVLEIMQRLQICSNWNVLRLDPSERHPIGNIGGLNQPMPVEEFKKFVSETLKFDVTHLPADKTMIEKSVLYRWCTRFYCKSR